MKINIFFVLLITVILAPASSFAHDSSASYSTCQKACTMNGLSCVLRCLKQSAAAVIPDNRSAASDLGDDPKARYEPPTSTVIRPTPRNFPASRPYNADFTSRRR